MQTHRIDVGQGGDEHCHISGSDYSDATSKLYNKTRGQLDENMGVGVVLTLVVILAYFCILVAGGLLSILLSTMMLDIRLTDSLTLNELVGSLCSMALCMFVIFPLRLSIKGWYQRLNGGFVSASLAFVIFTSPKRYWRAFAFGAVGFIVKLIAFAVCMLPCFFVSGLLRYSLNLSLTPEGAIGVGGDLAILAIADFVLLVLGIVLGIIFSLRFIYMDYLFLITKEKNPFKAIAISFRLSKTHKAELHRVIKAIIPYMLSCIFILPIPFAIPKISCILSIHARSVL